MPQDLIHRTQKEREEHIRYLASLPLIELRKRQDLVDYQNRVVYKNYLHAYEHGLSTSKWERAADNLDEMYWDLFYAIDRKEFPHAPEGLSLIDTSSRARRVKHRTSLKREGLGQGHCGFCGAQLYTFFSTFLKCSKCGRVWINKDECEKNSKKFWDECETDAKRVRGKTRKMTKVTKSIKREVK